MRTYKQLQDTVLQWMADPSDTGVLRDLVKNALNRTHQNVLNDDRYDFMLWPRTETLNVLPQQKVYALHPRFSQPLFFYNSDINAYLEEIPPTGLLEAQADWATGTTDASDRFMLTGVSKVQAQPATPGVVTITAAGTLSATESLSITGIANGVVVTEVLSSGSSWTTLTGTTTFEVIEDVTKIGTGWSHSITLTCGGTTILTLPAQVNGLQFRLCELLETPTAAQTLLYRFYRIPRQLTLDQDIPDLPAQFDDILVYQTLLAMSGYTRATPDEQQLWQSQVRALTAELQMTYQAARSINGRATYVNYIPRV